VWVFAIMLGLLGAAAFGTITHAWASNAGPFPETPVTFPLTDYVTKLDLAMPFEKLNHFAAYTGPGNRDGSKFQIERIEAPESISSLPLAKKALAGKNYSDAVEFALFALHQSKGNRPATREFLENSLQAWTEELSTSDVSSNHFDPVRLPELSEYFFHRNRAEGLRLLTRSALNEKNGEAMRILGLLFLQGRMLPQDENLGVNWLKNAADAGDRDARFLFAEGILTGHFTGFKKAEAIKYVQDVAAVGHPLSQELLGISLLTGNGMEADKTKGFEWLRSSAEKDNPGALFHLGLCHAAGAGTEKDLKTAAITFQKAAEQGDIRAMHQYGICLENGLGIQSSWPLACRWIKKAAMAGHQPAKEWCRKRRIEIGV